MKIFPSFVMMLTSVATISIPAVAITQEHEAPVADAAIQKAVAQLNQYADRQKTLKVQDPDMAYGVRKALLIADLLINENGRLNSNSCPSIKAVFVPEQPEEYEVNMAKVLDQLDVSWQPFFDRITAPQYPNSSSTLALRCLFSLPVDQSLTDRHAKVAVLAAMLSPYNQGPVGDCFAVNDVIRDHEEYYRHAADDYKSVVTLGYIERPVDNNRDYFFFLPILADSDRDQPFILSVSGAFPGTGYTLFDAPGFAAARSLMGGNEITSLTNDTMQLLSQNIPGDQIQITVTPSQVIAAMAQAIAAKTSTDALGFVGEYAFSSLTSNPIMRGVESAFAAMAEDRAQDSTRGNINDSVNQALKDFWTGAALQATKGAAEFQQAFKNAFNASYRLVYNLNIPLAQVSADGSSTDGGFQLYKRILETPTAMGDKVTTPEDFRQLVLDAIATATNAMQDAQALSDNLTNYVHMDVFLNDVLRGYDPANQQDPNPIQDYLKLARTPMQSCDGDNPFEVDDIDTETTYDNNVQAYTPNNARDLISWCLTLAKTAPAEMIPMDSPQHAFNFMPANPDLLAFAKNGSSAGQWIQKTLVAPGMQVSKRQISPDTQQAVAQRMQSLLSNVLTDGSYQLLVQSLAQKTMSVQAYAQQLLDGINNLLGSDATQAQEIAVALDGVLLESLPAADQAILEQSAIRFAFTNWNEGSKDIYFCAFFNPRTQKVGFGTIFEDKTNLQPMDEEAWVNKQQWDVDLKPFAPTDLVSKK